MKTEIRNKIICAFNSAKNINELDSNLMKVGHLLPIEKKETSFLISCFNRKLNILKKSKNG